MAQLTIRRGRHPIGSNGMSLDWAVGDAPARGQTLSGDRQLIAATEGGVFLAVLDALGHGVGASEVADLALEELQRLVSPQLDDVLLACHRKLGGTRGVVATLAWFDESAALSWLGVGNVAAVMWRSAYGRLRQQAEARANPGIIGLQLPPLRPMSNLLKSGDILVVATDGITVGSASDLGVANSPEAIARGLVEDHKITSDDGLVVVARYTDRRHD